MLRRASPAIAGFLAVLLVVVNTVFATGIVACRDDSGMRLEWACVKDPAGRCLNTCQDDHPAGGEVQLRQAEKNGTCHGPCEDLPIKRADDPGLRADRVSPDLPAFCPQPLLIPAVWSAIPASLPRPVFAAAARSERPPDSMRALSGVILIL